MKRLERFSLLPRGNFDPVQRHLLLVLCIGAMLGAHAQEPVTIHGKVITSSDQHTYYDLMIVNKRTRTGTFGNADGSFTVQALRTDTLMIGSIGHHTGILCLKDSVERAIYDVRIRLVPLKVQLAEVEILPLYARLSAHEQHRVFAAHSGLRVVLATIHVSLRDAIAALDFNAVLSTIRIADAAARRWGLGAPRIAVAGLNPHAGEGGLFGDEEIRFIGPAVQAARADGIDASGPHPPDTVFMRARRGAFDLVVAMTHDHGLIPVKYLGVEEGVNVTLGLPFVRTSPDHGTAFDIAGQGRADPASLMAALRMARALAEGGTKAGAAG